MMKKIIIKQIDILTSKLYKDKTISEYLISITQNNIPLDAFIEIGDENKKVRVNELMLKHFPDSNQSVDEIIEEITLSELLKECKTTQATH
jgi:hypothetical protein